MFSVLDDDIAFSDFKPKNTPSVEHENGFAWSIDRALDSLTTADGKRPMAHQREGIKFILKHPRCFLWHEQGLGKTLTSLWSAKILGCKAVLVSCPLALVNTVWEPAVSREVKGWEALVCIGTLNDKLNALAYAEQLHQLGKPYVLIMNHDTMGSKEISERIINKAMFDLLIIDESTAFKNVSAIRTKKMVRLSHAIPRVICASGTPITQSPMDIHGQALIVCPDRITTSVTALRAQVMIRTWGGFWSPAEKWESRLSGVFELAHRRKLRDCVDLPPVTRTVLRVPITEAQKAALKNLDEYGKALLMKDEDKSNLHDILHAAKLRQEFLRVMSGYTKDGGKIDTGERMSLLMELIEETPRPVVIFATHRATVMGLSDDLGVPYIMGDVDIGDRQRVITEFIQGKHKALVAHPKTLGHGVTLTVSSTLVFWQLPNSLELYQQCMSRVDRIGQQNPVQIVTLVSHKYEDSILRSLQNKENMVESLENVLVSIRSY
jgi:SNF2 family DNA or RNA helicase